VTVVTETTDAYGGAVPPGEEPPAPAARPSRSFGEEGARLTYGSYLRVTELLEQQRLESDPPAHDELLFITIHQVYELWFKQLLHEATAVRDALTRGELWWAQHLLQRMHVIERVLVHQVDVLETMTPQDFLEFRQRLAPASGPSTKTSATTGATRAVNAALNQQSRSARARRVTESASLS
jgi:hypothetical protein